MKSIFRLTTAALGLVATLAQAGFPAWYPQNGFKDWGKIDEFRSKDSVLIIEDNYYHFADNLVVHSLSQRSDSIARLHQGVNVGFEVDVTPKGGYLIREVWLLPDTYTQSEGSSTTTPAPRPISAGRLR